MNGLDYHFDQMLDAHLEEYFEDKEDEFEGIEDDEPTDDEMMMYNSCGTPWHDGCR